MLYVSSINGGKSLRGVQKYSFSQYSLLFGLTIVNM